MKNRIWELIFVCLLVACAPGIPSRATKAAVEPDLSKNHLYQALSSIPANVNYVEFTDWALIKENEGFEDLSSADDLDKKMDFFRDVSEKYAIPSSYGLKNLQNHSELWGWDSSDLEWEVRSSVNIHPNYVLKFRSDFDLGNIIIHLKEQGFQEEKYENIPVYSRPADTSLDLLQTTELSILNTAVIEKANLLIMSSEPSTVFLLIDTFLAKWNSAADQESVPELIQTLGNTPGAFISVNACSLFGSQALPESLASNPTAEIAELERYEALGIGYRFEGSEALGRIILQFPDPKQAEKDLTPRQELAQTGMTAGANPQPYSEVLFSLSGDATVQANQIIMDVIPANNKPSRLFRMVAARDMIFATCP